MTPEQQKIKEVIETSFPIVNKQSQEVPFLLNKAQVKFLENMTSRDIILKARQEGFCVDTSTKILTSNLKLIRADEIKIGQKLVSVDENIPGGRGRGRKMRTSIVEAIRVVKEPAFLLKMDNGEELIATAPHKFLFKHRGNTCAEWRAVSNVKLGDEIRYILPLWEESNLEDYWFGGIIDGEGSMRIKKSGGIELCVNQVAGKVYDRLIKYITDNNFYCRLDWDIRKPGLTSKFGSKPVGRIVFNRMNEMFKLIGKTRPTRFTDWEWWNDKDMPGKRNGIAWSKIIEITPLGKRKMIDIQTSEKTFIANGFVSHNSSLILAIFTYDFLFKKNSISMSLSYETGAAEKLLDKVKLYIKDLGVPMKYNSRNEMYNETMGSTFYIGTAAALTTGRGQTITNLHGCVGGDTKLILPNGLTKKMKDIVIGDRVIAEDGSPTEVTNKWNTGSKPIKRIKLWYGNESIEVSPDHKIRIAIKKKNRLGLPIWKRASEVTTNDYVLWAYPKTKGVVKFLTIKRQKNSIHFPTNYNQVIGKRETKNFVVKTNNIFGYFLGYYLAEGHITKNLNKIVFACHKDETFYLKFKDLFPITPTVRIVKNTSGERKVIEYNSKELAVFVNDLVGRVKDKCVPEQFLYQYPKKFLEGLYLGWKDGDGSKTLKEKCSIVTIREKIARQMKQVFINVYHQGISLSYKENRERYGTPVSNAFILTEYYNLSSKKGLKAIYTRPRGISSKNGFLYVKIKSIEDSPVQETFEIEVSHPSHSFLTVGGIISNSEIAFYKDANRLMTGLLQSVPKEGRVILESTANGIGDYFHREWIKGINGDGAFTPHFFSWKEHEEYQIPVDKGFKPNTEETQEMIEYGLSKEQTHWKREKIKQFKTIDEFNQEYPITAELAFISSGNPAFDIKTLNAMLKAKTEPKWQGNLIGNKLAMGLEETDKGFLKIWEKPISSEEYVIGADVAEVNDYSVGQVLKKRNMEVVAMFRGKLPVDAFAKELERLGYFYNGALLGVERNNQGIAVLVVLNKLYYPNLYYREDVNDLEESSVSKIGWETNIRTRPILITDLGMYIRNKDIIIHDEITINELMTFVRTDDKPDGEAQPGCHDDTVISLGIAVQLYRKNPELQSRNPYVTHLGGSDFENNFDERSKAFDCY